MNNGRCWGVAVKVCEFLDRVRTENMLPGDFAALRFWAENAKYKEWRADPIGQISGIGLITFQYLRMQAGIDTTMPDKIIKRAVGRVFGISARNDQDFIMEMELLSRKIGCSQTLLCWAIWLKESDMKMSSWEKAG